MSSLFQSFASYSREAIPKRRKEVKSKMVHYVHVPGHYRHIHSRRVLVHGYRRRK